MQTEFVLKNWDVFLKNTKVYFEKKKQVYWNDNIFKKRELKNYFRKDLCMG